MHSYERLVVREAQSDLALLSELDDYAFGIVAGFTREWNRLCLEAEPVRLTEEQDAVVVSIASRISNRAGRPRKVAR